MTYFFTGILLLVLSLSVFTTKTFAVCVRITSTIRNPYSFYYTEPGKGIVGNWLGAVDTSGTMGTTPKVINVNDNSFQPLGSLIATGYVSFLESGSHRYDSEQILFRCSPDEEFSLREFYATNGDSIYAGMHLVNPALGLNETYVTAVKDVGIRIKNLSTGEYFSRYWKSRPLTNLDKDSRGWLLVKAKNFSDSSIELFKVDYARTMFAPQTKTGVVIWTQPAAYIAFKSKILSFNLRDGADSFNHYNGFYGHWPGAINLHNNLTVKRSGTCGIENVTPHIFFPKISCNELNNNMKVTVPINIRFKCQSGVTENTDFGSDMASLPPAIGFLPKEANIAAAKQENLIVASGSGVTHLLSDGYGSMPNIARGVGVRLYQNNGQPLNFILLLSSAAQSSTYGWYPALSNAVFMGESNGMKSYSTTIKASLERLPGKTATAGKFDASIQAIIQVQ